MIYALRPNPLWGDKESPFFAVEIPHQTLQRKVAPSAVHGEEKQAMTLRELLKKRGMDRVHYPDLHDSVEI